MKSPKESAPWAPSRWSPEKVRRFVRHVKTAAVKEAKRFVGPYDAGVIGAEIIAQCDEIQSVACLRSLGAKLIGDK
jgi:hypothetical protein